jgi:hypothetical protein
MDLLNCGLWLLSEVGRLGLRSSSESERLIGSVEFGFGVPRAEELVLDPIDDVCDGVKPVNLVLFLEGVLSEPHAGTGGRVRFGETATFLFWCMLGLTYAWGVAQSLGCCRGRERSG